MREPILNGLISTLAMVRTSVEMLEAELGVDGDGDLGRRAEVAPQLRLLAHEWDAIHARTAADFGVVLETFKQSVIELMLTGLSEGSLSFLKNRAPIGDVCEVGERYFLTFATGLNVLEGQEHSSATLFALATQDIRDEIADARNCGERSRYDDRIFRKVIALIYAIEMAGGRLDRRDDGGEASDAFVPKEPVGPRFTAEAESEAPDRREEPVDAVSAVRRR
jgi:hypothetical protein